MEVVMSTVQSPYSDLEAVLAPDGAGREGPLSIRLIVAMGLAAFLFGFAWSYVAVPAGPVSAVPLIWHGSFG
jgi:hypothetical protein